MIPAAATRFYFSTHPRLLKFYELEADDTFGLLHAQDSQGSRRPTVRGFERGVIKAFETSNLMAFANCTGSEDPGELGTPNPSRSEHSDNDSLDLGEFSITSEC